MRGGDESLGDSFLVSAVALWIGFNTVLDVPRLAFFSHALSFPILLPLSLPLRRVDQEQEQPRPPDNTHYGNEDAYRRCVHSFLHALGPVRLHLALELHDGFCKVCVPFSNRYLGCSLGVLGC